jgi:hypothetical protein
MPGHSDISDKVIHFTKAATHEDALGVILSMVGGGRLMGATGMIRGGYRCVCFTEAPLPAVASGLVNAGSFTRYSPFGLMFEKSWIYERGGRPVIYQADSEFAQLPEEMRWRHVRYEPTTAPPIDFTWEREWRVHCDELQFSPNDAVLVVPNQEWEDFVFGIWDSQQQLEAEAYSAILDQMIIAQLEEPCPWRIVSLTA